MTMPTCEYPHSPHLQTIRAQYLPDVHILFVTYQNPWTPNGDIRSGLCGHFYHVVASTGATLRKFALSPRMLTRCLEIHLLCYAAGFGAKDDFFLLLPGTVRQSPTSA